MKSLGQCILALLTSIHNFFLKKIIKIDHGAASIRKWPLIKKYYFKPYFCGLYSRAACNRERLLMARLRYSRNSMGL